MSDLPLIADYGSALSISFAINAVFGGWQGVYKHLVDRQQSLSRDALKLDKLLSAEIELESIAMDKLNKTIHRGQQWRRGLWQFGRAIGFFAAIIIYVALFHFPQEPVTPSIQIVGMLVAYASPGIMVVMMLVGWRYNRSAKSQIGLLQVRANKVEQHNREMFSQTFARTLAQLGQLDGQRYRRRS